MFIILIKINPSIKAHLVDEPLSSHCMPLLIYSRLAAYYNRGFTVPDVSNIIEGFSSFY